MHRGDDDSVGEATTFSIPFDLVYATFCTLRCLMQGAYQSELVAVKLCKSAAGITDDAGRWSASPCRLCFFTNNTPRPYVVPRTMTPVLRNMHDHSIAKMASSGISQNSWDEQTVWLRALVVHRRERRLPADLPLLLPNSNTKYTAINFAVKNLWEQFHRPANVYFLGISILQCIEAISITGGTPTTLAPLMAVLIVSGQRFKAWRGNRTAGTTKPQTRVLFLPHES